jgi:hypothetical protein
VSANGCSVAVLLAGVGDEQFRGLFVQARNAQDEPVGEFLRGDDEHVMLTNCGSGKNVSTVTGNYMYHPR